MDNEIMELMTKMYAEMLEMKSDMKEGFAGVNSRLDALEKQVTKNTVSLENLEEKVKIVAECQVAFAEQLGRANEKNGKTINDRLDIIELAVTASSKEYNKMHGVVDFLKDKVGINSLDIELLFRNSNN